MNKSMFLLVACLGVALAAPAPAPNPDPSADDRPEIIEIIAPAASAQETLATLNLGAPGSELSERNKRTIGILRQLFPTLTQIIDQKVQQITSFVLRTFGPVLLRSFLGGNRGGANSGTGSGTIELDDDDDDDDDSASAPSSFTSTTASTSTTTSTASSTSTSTDISTSTETSTSTEANTSTATSAAEAAGSTSSAPPSTESASRRRRALRYLPNAIAEENQLLSGAESQQAEVRVAFGDGQQAQQRLDQLGEQADQQVAASEDQQTAAQNSAASIDEITLEDADNSEENRNKRFLNFGGSAGGGGGGSGNFLFDIVRLVAGSSSGSSGDGGAGAEGEEGAKGDNLTEGVPGPITRLFIIANRGIANLIQDLILRIAQTSERIVNFKARLITSII